MYMLVASFYLVSVVYGGTCGIKLGENKKNVGQR